MRNIFDQYKQPENRLTHALLCSLAEDQGLLLRFVRTFLHDRHAAPPFIVYEQSLPGVRANPTDEEADLNGLPDGCIVDKIRRAWLIESKIAAPLRADQLRRHRSTAAKHDLRGNRLLVLTTTAVPRRTVRGASYQTWSKLYSWLHTESKQSEWAKRCMQYFESAEEKFLGDNYHFEGTLTVFKGIPFGSESPYQYSEAKRYLGLLRNELLARKKLIRHLGIDPANEGRAAVTGAKELSVWDYIALKAARGGGAHTKHPHLTLNILADRLEAYVTVPNGVASSIRSRLFAVEPAAFFERVQRVTSKIERALHGTGGVPRIGIVQRRYRTQRSAPFVDATLRLDPRTAFDESRPVTPYIRKQPQWLVAVYDAMTNRRSNLQFQIGAEFSYNHCPVLRSPKIVKVIEDVWLACEPFVKPT